MTEIELKFVIDEPMAGRLWTRAKELKLVSGSRRTRTLRSVYLDTPEHVLKNAGINPQAPPRWAALDTDRQDRPNLVRARLSSSDLAEPTLPLSSCFLTSISRIFGLGAGNGISLPGDATGIIASTPVEIG